MVELQLEGWTTAQREGLAFLVEDAGIAAAWGPHAIRVPEDAVEQVRMFMDFLSDIPDDVVPELAASAHFERAERVAPLTASFAPRKEPDLPIPDVARPHLRMGGSLIDAGILAVAAIPVVLTGAPTVDFVFGLMLSAVYEIGLIASRGRTVGNMAAHTRVVSFYDRSLPTVRAAGIRWLVPRIVSIAVFLSGLPEGLDYVWFVAVYAPVFFRPHYRGLHDRASGIMVLDDHRTRSPIAP